jgi:hypothetical protein
MTVFAVFFTDKSQQIPQLRTIDLGDPQSQRRLFTGYGSSKSKEPVLLLADPWGNVGPPLLSQSKSDSELDVFERMFAPTVSKPLQWEFVPTGAPIVSLEGDPVQPVADLISCTEGVHPVAIVKRERQSGYWIYPDGESDNSRSNEMIYFSTLFRMRRFVAADDPPRFNWAAVIQVEPNTNHDMWSARGPASLAFAQVVDLAAKAQPDSGDELIGEVAVDTSDGPLLTSIDDRTLQFQLTDSLYCVHALSPLNQLSERPLFTLRGTRSFEVKRVYLYSTTAFFAVVEDGDRNAVVILGGRPGDQSLDDLYVCATIPKVVYKSSAVAIPRECLQRPAQVPVIGVLVDQGGKDLYFAFVIPAEGNPLTLLRSLGPISLKDGKIATSIESPPCEGLTNGFAVFDGKTLLTTVQFSADLTDFRDAGRMPDLKASEQHIKKWALRWENHFNPTKTQFGSKGETSGRLLGFEVDDTLFLLIQSRRDEHLSRYYSPGSRNVVLRADIQSLYNRFYWHAPDEVILPEDGRLNEQSRLLITVVDIGSLDSTRRSFLVGTAPGLYSQFFDKPKEEEAPEAPEDQVFRYAGEDGDVRSYPTWWLYFNNGGLPVGLSFHRTICQLFAAFCCAAVVRVYGPGGIIRDFRLSSPLFDLDSFREARSRLIATYGTLLKVGMKNLGFAARELATTKANIGSFKNFLRQLDPDWHNKFASQFLPEVGLEGKYPLEG